MLATKIANMVGGTGITVTDGRSIALSSATQTTLNGAEQTANKDQANGYAGLNASSELVGPVKIRYGTAAALYAETLLAGQPAFASDFYTPMVGDGVTPGGIAIGGDNESTINVYARHGSLANNGAALRAAYAAAKLRTPYGSAIARGTNEINILLRGGEFNTEAAQLLLDTSGINLISADGPGAAIISASTASRISFTNAGNVMRGLTFKFGSTNSIFSFTVQNTTAAGANLWEDLFFDTGGNTTTDAMICSGSATGLFGTYRRLRTVGERLLGGLNSMTIDASVLFEDCVGGDRCFGSGVGSTGTLPGNFGGTLRRCILNGANWNCNVLATGIVEDCTFNNCFIPRLTAGATIRRTTILPASGTCLGNATDTAAIKAYQCNLRTFAGATPYGTNITNSVGTDAQAMNVVRDGL